MSSIVVVDLIKDVVEATSAKVAPLLAAIEGREFDQVYFEYGKRLAIIDTLTQKTQSAEIKYPLIALFMPFDEDYRSLTPGIEFELDLNMAIVVDTGINDKTPFRYANNYKPVLYPIYDELMNQFKKFTYGLYKPFQIPANGKVPHIKTDNPYWSNGSNQNPQVDILDAIELTNLRLQVTFKNC